MYTINVRSKEYQIRPTLSPRVVWDNDTPFSEVPKPGILTHLNVPGITLLKPIRIWAVISPTMDRDYNDEEVAIRSWYVDRGFVIWDEKRVPGGRVKGYGGTFPRALRDYIRELLYPGSLLNEPDEFLTEYGLSTTRFL